MPARPETWAPIIYELARDARLLAKDRGLAGRILLRRLDTGATMIAIVLDAAELVGARPMGGSLSRARFVELVFDGPPWRRDENTGASIGPRLLGIEHDGKRVRTGEWRQRDGAWVLRLPI